jgi:hypothetical protein
MFCSRSLFPILFRILSYIINILKLLSYSLLHYLAATFLLNPSSSLRSTCSPFLPLSSFIVLPPTLNRVSPSCANRALQVDDGHRYSMGELWVHGCSYNCYFHETIFDDHGTEFRLTLSYRCVVPMSFASLSTKRLDYILMTQQLASHSTNCGAEPFNHRFYSNHREIWVDLELLGLFDRSLPPLARPQFRDIRLGRPKLIRKFITELGHLLSTSNIPARVNSLHNCNDILFAESLDEEITASMNSASKKCGTTE